MSPDEMNPILKARAAAQDHYDWKINPACTYHLIAGEFPNDHSIPWNCPTFYDGYNCCGKP